MFRNLPPADFSRDDLIHLSQAMISEDSRSEPDSNTPAGYTYLGQFIAHDISFDPTSSLQHDNDPDALLDYRTPRFDLDSVYGRGHADQPYLYDKDGLAFVLGEELENQLGWDVPRMPGNDRAIISDPRNDENIIISQLHSIFLRVHNNVVKKEGSFAKAQESVRWHYQWVVLYDFLPRVIDEVTYREILPHFEKKEKSNIVKDPPKLEFYKVHDSAYMPVEFSGAAYRFGHSTVRRSYRVNRTDDGGPIQIFTEHPAHGLGGFQRFNAKWGIDWTLFFQGMPGGDDRVQRARKIGTTLVEPLKELPPEAVRNRMSLAHLNLTRGMRLGLPSGQAVAHAMGTTPIPSEELLIGSKGQALTEVSPRFHDRAPLWCYVLGEARAGGGEKLGPVGSRIVMETIVGLMMQDGHSFLRQRPAWMPRGGYEFGMPEFLSMAFEK